MKLLDTNILIYAAQPDNAHLRQLFSAPNVFVSDITKVETLGYHKITIEEKEYFEHLFYIIPALPISQKIIQKAIHLKQSKKMSLGDALIGATAIIHQLILITANTKDFSKIPEIKAENPLSR